MNVTSLVKSAVKDFEIFNRFNKVEFSNITSLNFEKLYELSFVGFDRINLPRANSILSGDYCQTYNYGVIIIKDFKGYLYIKKISYIELFVGVSIKILTCNRNIMFYKKFEISCLDISRLNKGKVESLMKICECFIEELEIKNQVCLFSLNTDNLRLEKVNYLSLIGPKIETELMKFLDK